MIFDPWLYWWPYPSSKNQPTISKTKCVGWLVGWTVVVFFRWITSWSPGFFFDLRGLAMARWKKSGARKMSAIAQFFGGGSHTFAVQAQKKSKSRSFSVVSTIRSYCGTVGLSIRANVLFWGSWRHERITKWFEANDDKDVPHCHLSKLDWSFDPCRMIYLHALNLRRRLKKTKVGWLSSGVGQNDLEEYQNC